MSATPQTDNPRRAAADIAAVAKSPADRAAIEWRGKWLSALARFHCLRTSAPLEGIFAAAGADEWRWRMMIDNAPDEETLRIIAVGAVLIEDMPGLDAHIAAREAQIARLRSNVDAV